MFPQLFGKLLPPPPPPQKCVMTWYDTEFFLFQVLNSCPYFLNKLHNTLNKFRNIYIYKIQCVSLYSCFVIELKVSVLISQTLYKHLNRKKPI